MLSAIFCAIEEDNQAGLEELLNMANIDVNQGNKHGEAGVHIAAGLGTDISTLHYLHNIYRSVDIIYIISTCISRRPAGHAAGAGGARGGPGCH